MDALYSTSVLSSLYAAQENKQNSTAEPHGPSKLDGLEAELRRETVQAKTSIVSEMNGNSAKPTREQADMQQKYAPENTTLNEYNSLIADYTSLISQMQQNIGDAVTPMLLSTLESKSETQRMKPDQLQMLTSQFGLNKTADKQVKLARKFNRLQSQDTFI